MVFTRADSAGAFNPVLDSFMSNRIEYGLKGTLLRAVNSDIHDLINVNDENISTLPFFDTDYIQNLRDINQGDKQRLKLFYDFWYHLQTDNQFSKIMDIIATMFDNIRFSKISTDCMSSVLHPYPTVSSPSITFTPRESIYSTCFYVSTHLQEGRYSLSNIER
jgi:hypothetical protein